MGNTETSRNTDRSHCVAAALLALLLGTAIVGCTANGARDGAGSSTDRAAEPRDINASFKDPELDPDRYVQRFETESREVYRERDAIVEAVGLSAGDRIADIGAGTGLFLAPFSEAVGIAGAVFAVDISPRLIDYVRERVVAEGLANVEPVLSREDSAALAAGSVDVVFLCDTYHHFTRYEAMLASIHEALVDGGRLVVLDFERIPGVTQEWLLEHVRAGKEQVTEEVLAAGFTLDGEVEIAGLEENYFLRFVKK